MQVGTMGAGLALPPSPTRHRRPVGDTTGGKERREPRARPREAAITDAPRDGSEPLAGYRRWEAQAKEQEA